MRLGPPNPPRAPQDSRGQECPGLKPGPQAASSLRPPPQRPVCRPECVTELPPKGPLGVNLSARAPREWASVASPSQPAARVSQGHTNRHQVAQGRAVLAGGGGPFVCDPDPGAESQRTRGPWTVRWGLQHGSWGLPGMMTLAGVWRTQCLLVFGKEGGDTGAPDHVSLPGAQILGVRGGETCPWLPGLPRQVTDNSVDPCQGPGRDNRPAMETVGVSTELTGS